MATVIIGTFCGVGGLLNDRMIVTRMQDHMVVTADGAYHMLVNLGGNSALTMFTSTDGGATWEYSFEIPGTDNQSTSDIQLMADGQTLQLTYLNADNQVVYEEYSYDTTANAWEQTTGSLVDASALHMSVHPTVASTANGRVMVTYTEATREGLHAELAISVGDGSHWISIEGYVEGADQGSARIISTADKTGILYTTNDAMYWATVDDNYHIVKEQIAPIASPGMYSSHFSTTVYGEDIHVATPDVDGQLVYMTYDGETDTWQDPYVFDMPNVFASSAQISVSDEGNLYIVTDNIDVPNTLLVLESTDGGASWQHEATLICPMDLIDPSMKFETPDYFTDDLMVMMQIVKQDDPNRHGLYSFVVDVDGDGRNSAGGTGSESSGSITAGPISDAAAAGAEHGLPRFSSVHPYADAGLY